MKKQCAKCLKKFPATNEYFYKDKRASSGCCSRCKRCHNKQRKEYLMNQDNSNKHKERCKKYYRAHKNKIAEYYKDNRDQILKRKKEYRHKNKKKIAEYKYWYHKNRYKNDLQYRLLHNCGNHIRKYLKQNKNDKRSTELLGCSILKLKAYLEKQFDNKMSWKNYGTYWHIDHIIPCSSFDFTDPIQQQQCFHYANLQPLEAKANIKKGNKIL
jgi:hypothetical protein